MELQSNDLVRQRLNEFREVNKLDNNVWFSELCFCLLTANSKAKTALAIQNELQSEGFLNKTEQEIRDTIRRHGHRFHNNKARYIVLARQFANIKDILKQFKNGSEAREFLVKNIKGLGFKEASHFLRNVGYSDVAIIDRHILRYMLQQKLIQHIPKTISKKNYLEFEAILEKFNIPLDELDLIIWQKMTGEVLK